MKFLAFTAKVQKVTAQLNVESLGEIYHFLNCGGSGLRWDSSAVTTTGLAQSLEMWQSYS